MKNRIRNIVNFVAFNVLFFALYLNFIHKDKSVIIDTGTANNTTPGLNQKILVESSIKYLEQESAKTSKSTGRDIINTKAEEKIITKALTAN